MKLIYICGPYSANTPWEKEQNIRRAEDVAKIVAEMGYYPVCPHSNTRPYFDGVQPDEFWYAGTMELMGRCDGMALVDGWEKSKGARLEYEVAKHFPGFVILDYK